MSGFIRALSAGTVRNTPAGTIAAITVQAALNELDTEKTAIADLAANWGTSLVRYLPEGLSAVPAILQEKLRQAKSVFDFMSAAQIADVKAGTVALDTIDSLDAAAAQFGAIGGKLFAPAGRYKTSRKWVLPKGIQLYGEGYWGGDSSSREGTTSIYAVHSESAILSLKGSHACTVEDIALEAGPGTFPKTGLLLGRSGDASSGWHKISRVSVWGYFSVAGIYSIASEDNQWCDIVCWIFGGGALYGFVTSTHDIFGVDSLHTSSNLTNTVTRLNVFNTADSDSAACLYMENSQSMGSWTFIGGYLIAARGDYIRINNGALDGLAALGPFTFVGLGGEILNPIAPYANTPTNGIQLTANGSLSPTVKLPGLTVKGERFALINYGGIRKILNQDAAVILVNPDIVLPPVEDPSTGSTIHRSKIIGGIVDIGTSSNWIDANFEAGWGNTYGAPYAPAGSSCDPMGWVTLRGTLTGGAYVMFGLPAEFWPSVNMFFSVYAGGVLGRVSINTAGQVNFLSGTATEVDLSGIRFKLT